MEKRKDVKIRESDWAELSHLAINQRLSLQTVIDKIIEAYLKCVKEGKI